MRKQLGQSIGFTFFSLVLISFISACGSAKKATLYSGSGVGNQNIIPSLIDPYANGSFYSPGTNNSWNSSGSVTVSAIPSPSGSTGSTLYVVPSGASNNLYNFQFESNSIGASFVGSAQGVPNIGVTSSTAGSVIVTATASNGSPSAPGRITLTFSGASGTACAIQGPYAISGYSSPQVGGSYYFSVIGQTGYHLGYSTYPEQFKILNVWTQDSSERASYYYAWDRFWMTFNSAGQKTIFVRAQSLSSGATCDAQLSINVSSPVYTSGTTVAPSCRIQPATGLGYCSQVAAYTYYYDGNSCQPIWTSSSCSSKGNFSTLSACQQAVGAGQCTSYDPTVTTPVSNVSSQPVYRMTDVFLNNNSMATWGNMNYLYTQNTSDGGSYFVSPFAEFRTYTAPAGADCSAQLYKCSFYVNSGRESRQFLSTDPNCNGYFRNGSASNPSAGYVCTSPKSSTQPLYRWYRAASQGSIYNSKETDSTLTGLGFVRQATPIAHVPVVR